MNRFSLSAVFGGLILLSSCSQEEMSAVRSDNNQEGLPISFRAGVSSRVDPNFNYLQNPATFFVTAFRDSHTDNNPLFTDLSFSRISANLYASASNPKWPAEDDGTEEVEFFAYAPSLDAIQQAALTQLDPTSESYTSQYNSYNTAVKFFNLLNSSDPMNQETSTFAGVPLYPGYVLGRFYVATDISKQIDFITAHVSHAVPKEEESKVGVPLHFKHQLSNIELKAFSGNPDFNIEIAGVRIGRPYTGGAIFNFCDAEGNTSNAEGGQWSISKDPQRLAVDYIYGDGDYVYRMGKFNSFDGTSIITTNEHANVDGAASIMGLGGNAMVLPTKNGAWTGTANPWIAPQYSAVNDDKNPNPWSADSEEGDMYFSVLLRVTLKPTSSSQITTDQIYPYGNNNSMKVVYIEREPKSNKIVRRYASKPFEASVNGNEIVEFGWAAVPVGVDWERGKKYVYTLDFTKGVGIQDPEDPEPGTPIIGSGISFSVSIEDWDEQPKFDVDVPSELEPNAE